MRRVSIVFGMSMLLLVGTAWPAGADHDWNGYHWSRTQNPFTVRLGDNVSTTWDSYLMVASSDWTASSVLDTPVVTGNTTGRKCRPTTGRVEVCSARYGFNGWLGLATIWLSGSHIVKGTAKVNDSYFNTEPYDDPNARQHVICQEIGHTLGLDHQQDPNSQSCMDDVNGIFDPAFTHPNAHDYEELELIYAHTDGMDSSELAPTHSVSIERTGPGAAVVTIVFWA